MFGVRRVIVGVSGSPGSLTALRRGQALARESHAMLVPVLAWTPPGGDLADRRSPNPLLRRIWEEAARQRLRDGLSAACGDAGGLTIRPLVLRGEPGPVLVDVADRADDLLILGAGGRGSLARVRRGRVSRYCLAHARCPVLAVPPADLPREVSNGLRAWAFRHRELTVAQALRDWESSAA